ncbi:MAG: hypothetical protein AABZ33_06000, partial [Chloroflexota bacterium]
MARRVAPGRSERNTGRQHRLCSRRRRRPATAANTAATAGRAPDVHAGHVQESRLTFDTLGLSADLLRTVAEEG